MESFQSLKDTIHSCKRCPRLVLHTNEVAKTRKREFRDWEYWGKPVSGFGDVNAPLWIIGLAPAAHGANRTGRMFTGDSSGNWLYRALFEHGFANQPHSHSADDGLILKGAFVSAAVRCAPPDNKPSREELAHCAPFLDREFQCLRHRKRLLTLGKIAFDATMKLLERKALAFPKEKPVFGHGRHYFIGDLEVFCSYHPSRQNTQTGRLTWEMWSNVFQELARTSSRE
jgi:uracil-DNA glycosylase